MYINFLKMKLTKLLILFLFLSLKGFSQQAVLTSSGEKVILNFLPLSGGTISGTLTVSGTTTISGTATLTGINNTGTITNTGALINTGNLTVNGNGTITGTLTTGSVTYPNAHGTAGQVLSTTGSGILAWTTPAGGGTTHTISETFGGGIVFYVTTDGLHGLIAETQDQSSSCSWYDAQNVISTSANHSATGALFTDWRLPTKNELSLLYSQKVAGTVGGFAGNYYWSSTEYDYDEAWFQGFSSDYQDSYLKTNTFFVRAIRAF